MDYKRMPIEIESPEQFGYDRIEFNLTESSFEDMPMKRLGFDPADIVLAYTDHAGKPELRETVAEQAGGLDAGDVLITAGAAAALFIIATSLLDRKDHLVVVRPNYATNIETPRAIGCGMDLLDLKFEEGFRAAPEKIAALIKPETKLVSITCPHNPTGVMMTAEDLREIIGIVESKGCLLLVDETYREMAYGGPLTTAASISPSVISVSSVSKTYGLPGVRIGWILTRNPELRETFLAAKEQIFICGSIIDEEIAFHLLSNRDRFLPEITKKIGAARGIVKNWMAGQTILEWVEPGGGVVCFPRIKADSGVDVDSFYEILNEKYKTFIGPGHWFEMDRHYFRLGFGWPELEQLEKGLTNISSALKESIK
ncbi:MAG TPA: pyridoxal phosphate-dependent aminotransferase [bacterium]|nr:pyridoxal phosphate-dependent aminotransferase [bacterium]